MRHAPKRLQNLPFLWPDPPLHVVLVEPEIPPNTGNIARLCAATGCRLHLIEPLGFKITDAKLKRAGLDYWDSIRPEVHADFETFRAAVAPRQIWLFSAGAEQSHFDIRYETGDALVFGPETRGLPDALLQVDRSRVAAIPIRIDHVRSLNLSTATGIVVYEALRQLQRHPSAAT